eukprot:2818879-Prymnesium_polylepis.1
MMLDAVAPTRYFYIKPKGIYWTGRRAKAERPFQVKAETRSRRDACVRGHRRNHHPKHPQGNLQP